MIPFSENDLSSSGFSWILFVEDEPSNARLVLHAFERLGIENPVVHVTDAETALLYLQPATPENPNPEVPLPSLVITDFGLPRIPGIEFVRRIKQNPLLDQIPCVIFSGSSDPLIVTESYRAGANCYLIKPYKFQDLSSLLSGVVGFFLQPNYSRDSLT